MSTSLNEYRQCLHPWSSVDIRPSFLSSSTSSTTFHDFYPESIFLFIVYVLLLLLVFFISVFLFRFFKCLSPASSNPRFDFSCVYVLSEVLISLVGFVEWNIFWVISASKSGFRKPYRGIGFLLYACTLPPPN